MRLMPVLPGTPLPACTPNEGFMLMEINLLIMRINAYAEKIFGCSINNVNICIVKVSSLTKKSHHLQGLRYSSWVRNKKYRKPGGRRSIYSADNP